MSRHQLLLLVLLVPRPHAGNPPKELMPPSVWPAADPIPRTSTPQYSVQLVQEGNDPTKKARGRLVTVMNPLQHFSIQPSLPGMCNVTRSVPEIAAREQCVVAFNGGLFNTKTKSCIGDVVSDSSKIFLDSNERAPRFGVTNNGYFVTGYYAVNDTRRYLHNTTVANSTFAHLVTGLIWLVRNKENVVSTAQAEEDMSRQESDTSAAGTGFVTMTSSRVAIGHNDRGQLLVLYIQGQSNVRGVDLEMMATMLLKFGAVNAINLDGGGSATMVQNGALVGTPSDHCPDPDHTYRCERAVTTAVCIKADPNTCPANCSYPRGLCRPEGSCECRASFGGSDCSVARCLEEPGCPAGHDCDLELGECTCPPGFFGSECKLRECPQNCSGCGDCDYELGLCHCHPGFEDLDCSVQLLHQPPPGNCGFSFFTQGLPDLTRFMTILLYLLGGSIALNTVLAIVVLHIPERLMYLNGGHSVSIESWMRPPPPPLNVAEDAADLWPQTSVDKFESMDLGAPEPFESMDLGDPEPFESMDMGDLE